MKERPRKTCTFFNIIVVVVVVVVVVVIVVVAVAVRMVLVCVMGSCSFPDVVEEVFSSCSIGQTGHTGIVLVLMGILAILIRV
jgi:hypothetical protein